ncbi:vezatin-like [Rhopilema esculentum]|uniref:vezatin-like n=1 Tax=Rhopilema esculentum TaxID=499914 RepID=UPI0031E26FCA
MMADNFEAGNDCEDLVFEGSPLSMYLQQIGNDDFCSYTSDSVPVCSETRQDLEKLPLSDTNTIVPDISLTNFFTKFKQYLRKSLVTNYFSETELKTTIKTIDKKMADSASVVSGNYLEEDKDSNQERSEVTTVVKDDEKKHLRPSLKQMTLMILQFSIALGCAAHSNLLSSQILVLSLLNALILVITICHLLYQFYISKQFTFICNDAINTTDMFTHSSESICKCFDKCFLLIRECEVISMGSTFYHPSMPVLKIAPRKRGMCIALRRCMAKNSLIYFESMKKLVLHLINHLPDHLKLLHLKDGICSIAVEDIMSSFDKDSYLDEGALTSAMIKSLICLTRSQLFEMFQIIRQVLQRFLETEKYKEEKQLLSSIESVMKPLKMAITRSESVLKDMESVFMFTKENEFMEKKYIKKTMLPSQRFLWGVKIDSSFLHLKSATGTLQQIENIFKADSSEEVSLDADVVANMDESQKSMMKHLLDNVKCDLEGARSCINEIEGLFHMASFVKNDECGKNDIDTFAPSNSNILTISPNLALVEPEGDLFLEAISDPTYGRNSTEDNMLRFEEEQCNQQIRESKMLMSELKRIFSYKKDPVGLLPFDLVKKRSTSHSNEGTQSSIDNVNDFDSQNIATEKEEVEDSCEQDEENQEKYPDSYSGIGIEKSNEFSNDRTFEPPIGILDDLKLAILNRQANNMISELTIETDTFEMDDIVE